MKSVIISVLSALTLIALAYMSIYAIDLQACIDGENDKRNMNQSYDYSKCR